MKSRRVIAALSILPLLLAGCASGGSGSPAPSASTVYVTESAPVSQGDPPTVTVTQPADPTPSDAGARPVTVEDVFSAPVPELCMHAPGRLVDGKLPVSDPRTGQVEIASEHNSEGDPVIPRLVLGDLTGDGVQDAAVVIQCNAGGVGWPDTVHLYTDGDTWLGMVDMGEMDGGTDRVQVGTMQLAGEQLNLTWQGYTSQDASCCPSVPRQGSIRWDGTSLIFENVREV